MKFVKVFGKDGEVIDLNVSLVLKVENLDAQDAVTMQMYTNKANKEIANRQLTKAVLIIKNLLHLWEDVMTEDTVKAMIDEAKRFLREVDK